MKKFLSRTVSVIALCMLSNCLTQAQIITNFAGGGTGGDGSPATAAKLGLTGNGSFDAAGNYYFVQDGATPRIRKINTAGIISTVGGTGVLGFSGDGGPATAADIRIGWTTVDSIGNIYLSDNNVCRIRRIDAATGIITTIAGNGTATTTGDGSPATAATIVPYGICFDRHWNNLYICANAYIRKINIATGIISYVAGNGLGGFTGDGGPATAAGISTISICMDTSDNLYIGGATRIRKIDMSTGIIASVGGTGTFTYSGDEIPATTAQFKEAGIAADARGNLFIADGANRRVRVIDALGIIHTLAGNGTTGLSGDGGPATASVVSDAEGVTVDACGDLYIADDNNRRIRKITFPVPILTTPSISLAGIITAAAGTTVTVTATVAKTGSSYIIHWMNKGIEFTTTTTPSVTYTKAAGIDTITARVVSTATYGCYDSTTSAGHVVKVPPVGVKSLAPKGELIVFPNPVTNVININGIESEMQYRLLNMMGNMVRSGLLPAGDNAINIKDIANGVYMLEVTGMSGSDRTISKIVKE